MGQRRKRKHPSVRGGIALYARHKAKMAPSLYPRPTTDLGTSGYTQNDPDARVREQVATDMRDIVKDYPEAGYTTLERWHQDGLSETQKILRQALKYQVKIGDERAFKLLGMGAVPKLGKADITLIELKSERQVLPINEVFDFSFSLQSDSDALSKQSLPTTQSLTNVRQDTSRANATVSVNGS